MSRCKARKSPPCGGRHLKVINSGNETYIKVCRLTRRAAQRHLKVINDRWAFFNSLLDLWNFLPNGSGLPREYRHSLVFVPGQRFMGLSPVNLFIGFAPGAEITFNGADEPEDRPFLFLSGMPAHRTFQAPSGHLSFFGKVQLIAHTVHCLPNPFHTKGLKSVALS